MTPQAEMHAALSALKQSIKRDVQAAINSFYERVHLTPSEIKISLIDVSTYGDEVTKRMVGDVKISLGEF